MSEKDISEMMKTHRVGFCKVPKDLDALPSLKATPAFMAPKRVDLRDYCTPTEDQGNKPWCAACAATNWAENILWRKNDYIEQIKPEWVYLWAKQHDGDPDGDGTTLIAVLEALKSKGIFPVSCKTRVIRNSRLAVKYALHKFGAILAGFETTKEWYSCTKADPLIRYVANSGKLGGHAVLLCGYDKEGVFIQNSWGYGYAEWGFVKMTWECFDNTFLYGAVLDNCLDGMKIN